MKNKMTKNSFSKGARLEKVSKNTNQNITEYYFVKIVVMTLPLPIKKGSSKQEKS
jgi:hypothetical protein